MDDSNSILDYFDYVMSQFNLDDDEKKKKELQNNTTQYTEDPNATPITDTTTSNTSDTTDTTSNIDTSTSTSNSSINTDILGKSIIDSLNDTLSQFTPISNDDLNGSNDYKSTMDTLDNLLNQKYNADLNANNNQNQNQNNIPWDQLPDEYKGKNFGPTLDQTINGPKSGSTYNLEGQIIDTKSTLTPSDDTLTNKKADTNNPIYKFMRGFQTRIIDPLIQWQADIDQNHISKSLNDNTTNLKNLGLNDDDIKQLDAAISENGTHDFNPSVPVDANMLKIINSRADLLQDQLSVNQVKDIIKLRKQASDISAQGGGAEKAGQFAAGATELALTVSASMAAGGIADSAIASPVVAKTLSKVGLNNTIGSTVVKVLGESVVETALDTPTIIADSEISETDFGSEFAQNFLFNSIGNTLGDAIDFGVKKVEKIKSSYDSAKYYKSLADFVGQSQEDLSKSIISDPEKSTNMIIDAVKKSGIKNITGNQTLDNILTDPEKLKPIASAVANASQSKIFIDIMSGTKLDNSELDILGNILKSSDQFSDDQVKSVLDYINSPITTDGKPITTSSVKSNVESVAEKTSEESTVPEPPTVKPTVDNNPNIKTAETPITDDPIDRNFFDKVTSAPNTLTDDDWTNFWKNQAIKSGISENNTNAINDFISKQNIDGMKSVDDLKNLANNDIYRYQDTIGKFINSPNIKLTDSTVTENINQAKATNNIRNMFKDDEQVRKFANSMSISPESMESIEKNTSGYISTNFNNTMSNSAESIINRLKSEPSDNVINDIYNTSIRPLLVKSSITDSLDGPDIKQFTKWISNASDLELSTLMKSTATMPLRDMSDVGVIIKIMNNLGINQDISDAFTRFVITQNGENATKLAFIKSLNLGPKATGYYGKLVASELSDIATPAAKATPAFKSSINKISQQANILANAIINGGDNRYIQSIYSNIANTIKNTEGFYTEKIIDGKVVKTFNQKHMSDLLNRNTVLAYLFRPSTQIKNILSNSADTIVDGLSNKFANLADSVIFGKGERGIVKNLGFEGSEKQADVLNKSIDTMIFNFENNVVERGKISDRLGDDVLKNLKDIKMNGVRNKSMLDKANKLLTSIMDAGDQPFRKMAELNTQTSIEMTNFYNSLERKYGVKQAKSMYKNATRDEFLKFIKANPLDDLDKAYIKGIGDYAVKTQNSWLKENVNKILEPFRQNPVLDAVKNMVMPFTSWSSNAIDKALDMIPLVGTIKNRDIIVKFLKEGDNFTSLDKRQFSTMIGRQMSGLSLISLGVFLQKTGYLKIFDESSADQRDVNQALNIPNFSIRLGQKDYIPLDFAEPGSWFLMLGSSIAKSDDQIKQQQKSMEQIGATDQEPNYWLNMFTTIMNGIKNMTLGNSVFSQMSAFSDLIDGTSENATSKILSNATRSLIPFSGLFTDYNKFVDPVMRQTRLESDQGNVLKNASNDLLAKLVPGYSKTLNYQYDITGAIKQRSQLGALVGVNTLIGSDNPEAQEWLRLYNATGKTTVIPNARAWILNSGTKAQNSQFDRAQQNMIRTIKLNADEYSTYSRIYGTIVDSFTKQIMADPQYNTYNDLQKSAIMEKVINRAGTISLNYYKQQYYKITDASSPVIKN